ncbi:hypothetical protein [Oceanicella sp. SM1341]|uniref:hypothetical protein n=1 Tax=Oceanicella sp. SM1341 TaxID=1548889 RepID=UPI000E4D99F6|nr:hypothetical protein [Oceanicella sp. SM1341]
MTAGSAIAALLLALPLPALAHPVLSPPSEAVTAAFDIVETRVVLRDGQVLFSTRVRGAAGQDRPEATGAFAGSGVHAYVWPTSLDSGEIGFEPGRGIVALAVTFHPDFDDAAGGGTNRDVWHPHWVVLGPDPACGGGLKVSDIPEGATPRVPPTWPGVPLLIDSPDYPLRLETDTVEVAVPLAAAGGLAGASFDGVTAGLRINADLHAPLLCVEAVFKVASGDLSLPGRVMPAE